MRPICNVIMDRDCSRALAQQRQMNGSDSYDTRRADIKLAGSRRPRVRFAGFNPPNDFFDPPPRVSVDLSSWGWGSILTPVLVLHVRA